MPILSIYWSVHEVNIFCRNVRSLSQYIVLMKICVVTHVLQSYKWLHFLFCVIRVQCVYLFSYHFYFFIVRRISEFRKLTSQILFQIFVMYSTNWKGEKIFEPFLSKFKLWWNRFMTVWRMFPHYLKFLAIWNKCKPIYFF